MITPGIQLLDVKGAVLIATQEMFTTKGARLFYRGTNESKTIAHNTDDN